MERGDRADRDLETPVERPEFYSRVRRGEYTALTRGAFVSTERLTASTEDERYLLLLEVAALLTGADLEEELTDRPLRQGSRRADRVIQFADPLADRPGESTSRVAMHVARVSRPLLQVELWGRSGRRYVVDLFWPDFRRTGEFDGVAKYQDPQSLRGRTPSRRCSMRRHESTTFGRRTTG